MTNFTSLETATSEDWAWLDDPVHVRPMLETVAANLIGLVEMGRGAPTLGWPIDNCAHALQTATRAHMAGEDEEMVVVALLHDGFDAIDLDDHGARMATLLKPYISPDHCWLIEHHAIFQDYHAKANPRRYTIERERFRGHPAFERTAHFCEHYDQNSFDPEFPTMPMEVFAPMVHRLVLRRRIP